MTPAEALDHGLRELRIDIDAKAQAKLLAYVALLEKWNRAYNLTAVREPRRMVSHHLLDSLAVLPHLPATAALRVVDIGSGGGSPGIPIAIARPGWYVALVEGSSKKAAFLRQAQAELPLPNVEVVGKRIEEVDPASPFDVAISRAFSDLGAFATAASRVTGPQARWFAMKGSYPGKEIAELPPMYRVAGVRQLTVPGVAAERRLVIMERAA